MLARRTIFFLIVVAIIIASLSLFTPLLSGFRNSAWETLSFTVGAIVGVEKPEDAESVQAKLETIQSENFRLKSELADYRKLREQAGGLVFDSMRVISTLITGQPLDVWHTELIVNKGLNDGIVAGSAATTRTSTLVGQVVEVNRNHSVVRTLSNPAISIPVTIQLDDENSTTGLLRGSRYTTITIDTIPRDKEIKSGMQVVTTGDAEIPPGLSVGEIDQIISDDSAPYYTATIKTPYQNRNLSQLTILVAP